MAQDKRNFLGGLNRDDDSRVAPNGDYFYAQNIRVLSSEDRNTQLVENVRGMTKEAYTRVFGGREGSFGSGTTGYKVIGAYEDAPNNCIYYFIWSNLNFHMILEYNVKTDTISTVFRDTGTDDNLLRFDKDTLITGINRIDDLLYWTCDNTYIKKGSKEFNWSARSEYNEPKVINIEKAKKGFTTYYDSGDYTPTVSSFVFNPETSYPYEFYSSNMEGSPNAEVDSWRKRTYINVHKRRPKHAPVYFPQTPIINNTGSTIDFSALSPAVTNIDGSDPADLTAGSVATYNISINDINSVDGLDLAYKKNNIYGYTWQFAYRYIYRDNEVSSWSEWSAIVPLPQYYQNKEDKDKQNLYNQLRVWYHNGPADVLNIEIAARKCNYAKTAPDQGNQGEYYLIATVDNNYEDSGFTAADSDFNDLNYMISGIKSVSTRNIPYIKSQAAASVEYSDLPLGFIDFRNDGVYTVVDPTQFNKLYDRVPKRAKAQEIISDNRIAYGNYTDGFNQTPIKFDLIPIYGGTDDPVIIDPTGNSTGKDGFTLGGAEVIEADPNNVNGFNEENYGSPPQINISKEEPIVNGFSDGYNVNSEGNAICFNADAVKITLTYTFPTVTTTGQEFNLKFDYRVKFKFYKDPDIGQDIIAYWPHPEWDASWEHYKHEFFGVQIDTKAIVAADGIDGVVDGFIEYINGIQTQTTLDQSGQNEDPEADNYNANYGQPVVHHYIDPETGEQGAAEMRMFAEQDPSNTNILKIHLVPQGQQIVGGEETGECIYGATGAGPDSYLPENDWISDEADFGCIGADEDLSDLEGVNATDYTLLDGTKVTNIHIWKADQGFGGADYADFTECGSAPGNSAPAGGGCYTGGRDCDNSRVLIISPNDGDGDGGDIEGTFSDNTTMSTIAGGNNPWSEFDDTNMSLSTLQEWPVYAGAFKSGAWHRFGLVYYDKEGRNSTVMLQEPSKSDSTKSSSTYVKFPPERKYKTQVTPDYTDNGTTTNELTEIQKLLPVNIGWRIWHQPPIWAESYQWVYARNTSVGKFMQYTIDKAFINKGAKPGTSTADAQADTKIYISLNTMDGRIWSYSEKNRALIGDWSFAEGDRMRIVTMTNSDGQSVVMQNPATNKSEYYDFKISDIGQYPGELVFNPSPDEDGNADGVTDNMVLAPDSPVGGDSTDPSTAELGKFIILDEPAIGGGFSAFDEEEATGKIPAWTGCIIEIYRPKKNLNQEASLYYEFSEKFPIMDAGSRSRAHGGLDADQSGSFGTDADGIYGTYVAGGLPAMGTFKRGDIWYKPRTTRTIDVSGNANQITGYYESYFLNDFLSTNHINIGRPNLSSRYATELSRVASVTYSDVYQVDTQYNGFHSFAFSQRPYIDYDISQGSIQKLVSRDTNLILLQEDKLSTVLVGKDIINSPSGDAGITLSTNVLATTATPATGEWGVCTNPESVAVHGKVLYFVDIKRGAVLRYAGDGLTAISEYKMIDFFRDRMDEYQNITIDEKLGGTLKIIGGYDPRHGEYIITFPNIYNTDTGTDDIDRNQFSKAAINFNAASKLADGVVDYDFNLKPIKDEQVDAVYDDEKVVQVIDNGQEKETTGVTLAFNEKANRWSSFYTFYPEYYSSIHRTFVSFKWGDLYKHDMDSSNYCLFHGNPYPDEAKLSFPFNGDVSSVKGWNNVSIEGIDRQEVVPIKGNYITVSTSSTTVTGVGTTFTDNDIEVGDYLYYYNSGTLALIGTIATVTNNTSITLSANSTVTSAALYGSFILTAKSTMYKTKFTTNINETQVTHRTSYTNDSQSGNSKVAGSWVMREDIGSVKIPYGTTNSVGGEYFGLGKCSTSSGATSLRGNTLADGSGTSTNTTFTTAGINVGDSVYYDNNGTETLIGVISSIVSDTVIVLASGATASLANTFMFVKKTAQIEGDRIKGHYMDTALTKRTKDKVHIFAVNANVNKSELSNK